jgi:hypothetical protein
LFSHLIGANLPGVRDDFRAGAKKSAAGDSMLRPLRQ